MSVTTNDRFDVTKVKQYLHYGFEGDDVVISYSTLDGGYREVIAGTGGHDNGNYKLNDFVKLATRNKYYKFEDLPKPPVAKLDLATKGGKRGNNRDNNRDRRGQPIPTGKAKGMDLSNVP
ncbi:hypothetical protein JCM11641_001592, partial [Rhodosporidiobolus odoratus]